MSVVADAGFVVAALADGGTDGLWAQELLTATDLAAPHLMPVEAANILRRAALAGEISQYMAALAHADLLELGVSLFPYAPFAERVSLVGPAMPRRPSATRGRMGHFEEIREVHVPYRSKLNAAGMLILGMEGLRPVGAVPVSQAAVRDAGSVNVAADQQRIGAALTSVVLYAVVVELVVKHFWEQEHGETAPYSHEVHGLFEALSAQTQHDVEALYNNCCVQYKAAVQAGQQQHGPGAVAVDMANLEEALQWNQGAVKDLKYDMTPRGRSVPRVYSGVLRLCGLYPARFRTSQSN